MNSSHLFPASMMLVLGMSAACLLASLPVSIQQHVHQQLRDGSTPFVSGIQGSWPQTWMIPICQQLCFQSAIGSSESTDVDSAILTEHEQSISRLERQILALNTLLEQQKDSLAGSATRQLFQPELIEARRITGAREQRWRASEWIDVGQNQQIREQDWILQAEQPLLDLGHDHDLQPEDLVLSGKAIIGQIDAVGRWSSTFRLVTDPEFRCEARVAKQQPQGRILSPIGSLHGHEDGRCRLMYIENTTPIAVGDYVVLHDPTRQWEQPLVLGKIVQAKVVPNNPFWTLEVQPVAELKETHRVMVLTEHPRPLQLGARQSD